ncbi:MAG: S1 RNA-binding domain-containing protein, partial [Eisenbergiella sp.]
LQVSQISKEPVEKPADVLKVGEEITAKVVDLNEDDKKISLSIKALQVPEKKEEAEEDTDVVSVDIDQVIADQDAE